MVKLFRRTERPMPPPIDWDTLPSEPDVHAGLVRELSQLAELLDAERRCSAVLVSERNEVRASLAALHRRYDTAQGELLQAGLLVQRLKAEVTRLQAEVGEHPSSWSRLVYPAPMRDPALDPVDAVLDDQPEEVRRG